MGADRTTSVADIYPLSPAQQGMLMVVLLAARPEEFYCDQCILTLSGPLDAAAWCEAWRRVVARHAALRTLFVWERRERPLQVVRAEAEMPWEEHDWRGLPAAERAARLDAFVTADHARGFDLGRAPLVRGALLLWEEGTAKFVWSFHHLVLDGWSISLVFSEVLTVYQSLVRAPGEAPPELPAPRPYRDYIAWLERQDRDEAAAYWRQELADLPAPAPLPFDGDVDPVSDGGGWVSGQEALTLAAATTEALASHARRHRLTLNTVFQGAWALLLARLAVRPEVTFGAVVSGRPAELPGVESMVGLFINALPVRVGWTPEAPLAPWLAALQERQLEMRRFEHSRLEEVQLWAGLPREAQLFASLLIFQNFPLIPFERPAAGEETLGVRATRLKESTHYPLALYVAPQGDGMVLALSHHYRRLAAAGARRLLGMLGNLLSGCARALAEGEGTLGELPLLGEAERQELLAAGRGPVAGDGAATTVLAAFAAQATRTPDAVAVEGGGERWTYGELAARVARVAAGLARAGVRRGDVVGICLDRSPGLIAAFLGTWQAGAAYLPLDPAYPPERLALLAADSGARLVVVQRGRTLGSAASIEVEDLLAGGEVRRGASQASTTAQDPAYVLYTSGSTGTPKGVVVPHGALAGYVASAARTYGVGQGDRVLQFAAASFDTSAEEIYPTLTTGATLVLRDREMTGSFDGFLAATARLEITLLDLPTAYWHELVDIVGQDLAPWPAAARRVILGGEEAQAARLAVWRQRSPAGIRLWNTYGPTEATIVAVWHDLTSPDVGESDRVPIGRPVPGARAAVLGADQELLPSGVDGELWLGGGGLARGYLGRPDLTADRFRPDPFATASLGAKGETGARLYRTGDLVRRRADGALVFRGRADGQVKLRGFRIELGEVEAALRRLPGVREAAVVVQGEAGGRRLAAFVAAPAEILAGELRQSLKASLPEHMVPAVVTVLAALPLTASGKVDRPALARLDTGAGEVAAESYRAPRGPVEEVLAGIWAELLQVERVGADDDFFSLGGHSLLVAQALARIRQALAVEIPLPEFFRRPTVADLGGWIAAGGGRTGSGESPLPPIERVPRDGRPLPLSYAQERVWFLDQLTPGGNKAYNFQVAIHLWGALDAAALRGALGEVVHRHEVLRTSFPSVDGQPVQVIAAWDAATSLRLPVLDLSALPAARRDAEAETRIAAQIDRPFDLAQGPLIRWLLLRREPRFHTLVQVEHHFVHDGWSFAVLLGELRTLYAAFTAGRPSPLPELPVQYADYAAWQRRWMEGETMERLLAHFKARLAGAPPALEIATDRPRPAQGSFAGDIALLPLDPQLYDDLRRFARRQGFTLYMTMLAGFLTLLHRYTGSEDVVIGTSNANRRVREIEGMVGMVVNSLVLRSDLSGRPTFRAFLGRVREMALDTYAHQDMPFERLVQGLRLPRRPGRNPLFQLMFNFHDAPIPELTLGDLEMYPDVRGNRTAKMDMNVIVVPRAEQRVGRSGDAGDREATLHWEFNTDLFDRATVERMAGHFHALLAGAVADSTMALAELPLLTAAETAEVLGRWNDTRSDYPRHASIVDRFALWAARTPAAPAVLFADRELTYGELDRQANRIAQVLRARGVVPGDRVALAAERSLALVPAILGILKSGAAYVPLDPGYPPERLAFMLADSGASLLLGPEDLLARLPSEGLPTLALDGEDIPAAPDTPVDGLPRPSDLAYVMYTSGSTGRPKGVAVTHRNVVRLVEGSGFARFGPEEVFLQLAPVSFDASTFELWGALLHGARLAVFPPENPSLEALGAALGRYSVTTLWLTAGLFHHLVEGNLAGLKTITQLLAGGDVLSPAHVRRALVAYPGLTLINGYGPTEGTTFSCCHPLTHGDVAALGTAGIPIGRPIGNARVYVLDGDLHLLPAGVPGELWIAGDGLAVGYLDRPDLTAERFRPDPFAAAEPAAGGRLYRTGDRARWRPDGTVDFLGRLDQQVKVRGYRIEPGEIEAVLAEHPAVLAVAVLPLPAGSDGDLRLVACVVPRAEGQGVGGDLATSLRLHLAAKLPPYMVPTAWVTVAGGLPLTANGKVDRRALARVAEDSAAGVVAAAGERVAPRTASERAVGRIWCEVLKVAEVGVDDDFFLLGGHSLSATRVLSRLAAELGVSLPLSELFEYTTLAALAAAVDTAAASAVADPSRGPASEEMSEEELDGLLREMLAE